MVFFHMFWMYVWAPWHDLIADDSWVETERETIAGHSARCATSTESQFDSEVELEVCVEEETGLVLRYDWRSGPVSFVVPEAAEAIEVGEPDPSLFELRGELVD